MGRTRREQGEGETEKRRTRRGRGEGGIYERADGRWCASVSLGYDVKGKRKRKVVYGATKGEVQKKLADLGKADRESLLNDPKRTNLERYLEHWLAAWQKAPARKGRPPPRESTVHRYREILRLYVTPSLGRVALKDLQPAHLARLFDQLIADGKTGRTCQLAHAVLRKALNQALKWGYVTRNVCMLVEPPPHEARETRALSEDELRRLLEAAQGDRLEPLYLLALMTGMRQGELLGLEWEDIDFEGRTLHVRQQLIETGKTFELKPPKTKKGLRIITLPAPVIDSLRTHRARMAAEALKDAPNRTKRAAEAALKGRGIPSLVFPGLRGAPMRKSHLVQRFFKPLLERAGLPATFTFHELRHSHATFLAASGVHPSVAQQRLGHANISTTLGIYSHALDSMQRDAADKIGGLLNSIGYMDGYKSNLKKG